MSPHPLFFFSHRHHAPRGVAGKGNLEVRMEKMAMGIDGEGGGERSINNRTVEE